MILNSLSLGTTLSQSIRSEEMVAFEDLGPEAIRHYEVVDFPAIVGIDIEGNDVYKLEIAKYAELLNKY